MEGNKIKNRSSIKQEKIREYHRKKIIDVLSKNNKLTKRQIAKRIGISLSTVITIINKLSIIYTLSC